ncbi:hypothetical protein [Gordonia polyisoprenivorans]|uniref:hypothetical protein n=1 Tax=Gordonia polyisoprenivorans TaxID=84595 RepID=UPI000B99EC6A|nr:hypothetical protein [Gordonia polyisoprenivorans]OZC31216.1 hypothetical protein CJJ17_06825 [Gordonia polyisoprenivorans]
MSQNGFGQFLPSEPTPAQVRRSPGYRQGFGRHIDGSQAAANLKRSQLAAQRRARIRNAINAGTATYDRAGRPVDPIADNPEAIEVEWSAEYGPRDED